MKLVLAEKLPVAQYLVVSRPMGTGTFVSAVSGGYNEQKGVAAVKI